MRAALVVALLLLCTGCAALRRGQPQPLPVRVVALEVDFPTRDRGELRFRLQLPPGVSRVKGITWELFLDGVRFAAGVEGQLDAKEGVLELGTALVSRHLVWREGEGRLDVGLRGEVAVGGEALQFKERREVQVSGRPVWTTE